MTGYNARFGGIRRLFGTAGSDQLQRAHVCVVGIGGVGSWVVEALARSGLGRLTLVDFDDVCISNSNRQLHAMAGTFGRPKVEVMAERVQAIQPGCQLAPVQAFFTAANATQILASPYDYLVDAIDRTSAKCLLIAGCVERGIPIITAGAAGGRRDPSQARIDDLACATHDRLLQGVRSRLRAKHGFPRQRRFGVPCVYSPEPAVYVQADGSVCAERSAGQDLRIDCNFGYGTASFVTGTFGFLAAAHVVRAIAGGKNVPE